jgi:hypothetical protein
MASDLSGLDLLVIPGLFNAFTSRDMERDGGIDGAAPKGLGDVFDAVRSGDVEGLRAQAGHDAGIDADAASVLGEGHVSNPNGFRGE